MSSVRLPSKYPKLLVSFCSKSTQNTRTRGTGSTSCTLPDTCVGTTSIQHPILLRVLQAIHTRTRHFCEFCTICIQCPKPLRVEYARGTIPGVRVYLCRGAWGTGTGMCFLPADGGVGYVTPFDVMSRHTHKVRSTKTNTKHTPPSTPLTSRTQTQTQTYIYQGT